MHAMLSAYILSGGEARDLSKSLSVPLARVSEWMRDAEIPDQYMVGVEAAAYEQVARRMAELSDDSEADPAARLRDPTWRARLMDLDRAHWILHGISYFEFRLRVALKLAQHEARRYGDWS